MEVHCLIKLAWMSVFITEGGFRIVEKIYKWRGEGSEKGTFWTEQMSPKLRSDKNNQL